MILQVHRDLARILFPWYSSLIHKPPTTMPALEQDHSQAPAADTPVAAPATTPQPSKRPSAMIAILGAAVLAVAGVLVFMGPAGDYVKSQLLPGPVIDTTAVCVFDGICQRGIESASCGDCAGLTGQQPPACGNSICEQGEDGNSTSSCGSNCNTETGVCLDVCTQVEACPTDCAALPPNTAPTFALTATPTSGAAPMTVTLTPTDALDPEGDTIGYTFGIEGTGGLKLLWDGTGLNGGSFDYDGDGALTAMDVAFLTNVRFAGGICPEKKNCDANGDGASDASDLFALIRLVSSSSAVLPIEIAGTYTVFAIATDCQQATPALDPTAKGEVVAYCHHLVRNDVVIDATGTTPPTIIPSVTTTPPSSTTPPTIIPSVTTPPSGPACVRRGDVNCDEKLDVADVAKLARHVVGLIPGDANISANGDASGDGRIDVGDVSKLARHVVGLVSSI